MKNYDRINALPPEGIERKRAHIVGGGIAGLASAVFLVDDAHMPGENITIYESAAVHGGGLDAAWDPKAAGYKNRGSRMFERRYECLCYLEPLFDVRVIAKSLEMAVGSDTLNLEILDKVRSSTGGSIGRLLDAALSRIPDPDVTDS
jgi:myosin-crossreactive antigen